MKEEKQTVEQFIAGLEALDELKKPEATLKDALRRLTAKKGNKLRPEQVEKELSEVIERLIKEPGGNQAIALGIAALIYKTMSAYRQQGPESAAMFSQLINSAMIQAALGE